MPQMPSPFVSRALWLLLYISVSLDRGLRKSGVRLLWCEEDEDDESKFKVSTEPARVDPSRLLLVLMAGVRTLVLCGGSSETKSGSEMCETASEFKNKSNFYALHSPLQKGQQNW